jgi:hypothetical protein
VFFYSRWHFDVRNRETANKEKEEEQMKGKKEMRNR